METPVLAICCECNLPIGGPDDPFGPYEKQRRAWPQVKGLELPQYLRSEKSGSSIAYRKPTDEFAHDQCGLDRHRKLPLSALQTGLKL